MLANSYDNLKKSVLEKYFGKINDMQREAVFSIDGPLLVLAGAGSGKTTVIINRIANMISFGNSYFSDYSRTLDSDEEKILNDYLAGDEVSVTSLSKIIGENLVKPWNVLALTFTNKAAGELKSRLSVMLGDDAKSITAATFHSACVRILRREIEKLGYVKNFTIYDSDESQRVIKSCIADMNLSEKQFSPKMVQTEISSAKDKLLTPKEVENQAENDYRITKISKVYAEYQKRLFASGALDFDDIIMLTVKLFKEFPDVLDHYQNLYKYIMVDEYQDTNYAQFILVQMLASKYSNICVVGDDDQSIYKFRGATIENILNFEKHFEGAKVIRLEQNYRSTQNILDASNSVIRHNSFRKEKTLWTDAGEGEKVLLYKAANEFSEASFIADTILKNISSGGKYSDHAVLYRMSALSNNIEKALVKSGIPYKIVGGLRFFDRKEIKDIVAYLSVINNPGDLLRLKRIINEPKRGLGDTTISMLEEVSGDKGISPLEIMRTAGEYPVLSKKASVLKKLAKMFDVLSAKSKTIPLTELLDRLMNESGYGEYINSLGDEGIARRENIAELKSTMEAYIQEAEEPTLSGFLEEVALYTDIDNYEPEADRVVLMTIHAAKGLEFNQVFIVGAEEGIFPSSRSMMSDEEIEEERRLAYVAFTRARKKLYIIRAEQRMLFGMTTRNSNSRFTKEITPSLVEKIDSSDRNPNSQTHIAAVSSSIPLQQQLKKKTVEAPSKSKVNFTPGDRVSHNIFGEGTVITVTSLSGDNMLEVAFDKTGTKKLMANFARIVKL